MKNEESRIVETLARLRAADAGREASAATEAILLDAFRRGHQRRFPRKWQVVAAGMAAAVIAALVLLAAQRSGSPAQVKQEPPAVAHDVKPSRTRSAVRFNPVATASRHRVMHAHHGESPRKPSVTASTAVSEFIPVPYAPPLPSDEIRIVRVQLSPYAGLAPQEADVVTGVDGIVRAVRWVR